MKTKLILSTLAILAAVVFSCKKTPEVPTGSNKIEIEGTTIDSISYYSAKIRTTVSATGGNVISQHGHCWGTEHEPTTDNAKTELGNLTKPDAYTSDITQLLPNTEYFVRSYLTYKYGVVYGDEQTITTLKTGVPTVNTTEVSNITLYTAQCGGNAIADSGLIVVTKGVCWNTDSTVNIENNIGITNEGDSLGAFSSLITELQEGITYYVTAYSTNNQGTSYGRIIKFSTVAITLPEVTTSTVSNILATAATSGGNITSNGNGTVSARGVCWNTNGNPTLDNNLGHTINGSGTGEFVSNISGLTDNTTYYIAAYATNEKGTSYGEVFEFTTLEIVVPEVTTANASNLTMYSALSGGNVTGDGNGIITARGICWSTNSNPTIADNHTSDGSGTGVFESNITGLTPTTQYYARAYATNSAGTAYGNEISFTTLSNAILPSVITSEAINITQTNATGGGNVTSDGGGTVSARGICWSTLSNPSLSDNYTTDGNGIGTFTSNIAGLTQNTTYYIRAYATNGEGTAYGNQVSFITLADPVLPSVTTDAITNITQTTANSGGNVTSDGGAEVSARGVCWSSTNVYPDLNASHSTDGSGTGEFTSLLTDLTPNTFYYVRSYATNGVGTTYGNTQMFTTLNTVTIPTVTTAEATNITQTEATTGGTVHADGGADVTARGVCYSTTSNPTLSNTHTTNGTGLGAFVSLLTSLTPNTQYYVKAYATNSEGTAYGNEITFITLSDISLPTVTTDEATNITQTTATSGGNVTDDGGADVTARGVCWSISNNPTLADSYTTDGNGTGTFVSEITGLTENTTYYVRAYATNIEGTAYGNEVVFTTLPPPWQCGDLLSYEGQDYTTVLIGDQCWMAENLNVGLRINGDQEQTDNGQIEKYCYDDVYANCNVYGGLYQWDEMMEYTATQGAQGICPSDWHIPTDDEWKILEGTTDSQYGVGDPEWDGIDWRGTDAGYNLKSTTGWNNNGNGINAYGFSAFPAGVCFTLNHFDGLGDGSYWWVSNYYSSSNSWFRSLGGNEYKINRNFTDRNHALSIRCIKN